MLWEAGGKKAAANRLIQSFCVPHVSCSPSEVFCESFLLLACLLRARVVLLRAWLSVLPFSCSQWMCYSACSFLQAEVLSISQQGLALDMPWAGDAGIGVSLLL